MTVAAGETRSVTFSSRLSTLPAGAALVAVLSLGGLAAVDAANSPAAQAVGQDTFTNPLAPDTADPTIEFHDGNYYMVATTWDNKVVMRKAPTLAGLGTTKSPDRPSRLVTDAAMRPAAGRPARASADRRSRNPFHHEGASSDADSMPLLKLFDVPSGGFPTRPTDTRR